MTSSWILNITNYTLTCAQVSDVSLEAIRADEHPVFAIYFSSSRFAVLCSLFRGTFIYLVFSNTI